MADRSSAEKLQARSEERKRQFTTLSGIPVERVYTAENSGVLDAEAEIGYPGEYPFTRGVYPTLYRGRLWTMRQYAGFGSAAESNRRSRYLLARGQTGLSIAFDF